MILSFTFYSYKESTYGKIKRLIKCFAKNRLKISPKKCQLFKMELQYMRNTIFIKIEKCVLGP